MKASLSLSYNNIVFMIINLSTDHTLYLYDIINKVHNNNLYCIFLYNDLYLKYYQNNFEIHKLIISSLYLFSVSKINIFNNVIKYKIYSTKDYIYLYLDKNDKLSTDLYTKFFTYLSIYKIQNLDTNILLDNYIINTKNNTIVSYLDYFLDNLEKEIINRTVKKQVRIKPIYQLLQILNLYSNSLIIDKLYILFDKYFQKKHCRMLDAILFLLFDLIKAEQDALKKFSDLILRYLNILNEVQYECILIIESFRRSYLKFLLLLSIKREVDKILSYCHSQKSKELILILSCMHYYYLDKSNIVNLINELDLTSQAKLCKDLRRNNIVINNNFINIREIEHLLHNSTTTDKHQENIIKIFLLYYTGVLNYNLLYTIYKNYKHFFLNDQDIQNLLAVCKIDYNFIININQNLFNNNFTVKLFSTSKFFNIKEYYKYTLCEWSKTLQNIQKQHTNYYNYPLVSIIITTYNPDLDLIAYSLQSICLQTYSKIEIICIDDHSQLHCSEQLQKLLKIIKKNFNIPIIYQYNEKNLGQYQSRNIALKLSHGDYIAIQDDDDLSHPERVAKQIEILMQEKQYVAISSKQLRINDHATIQCDGNHIGEIFGDSPVSTIYRKTIFEDIGNFCHIKTRGDIEFLKRIENNFGSQAIKIINLPLVIMRGNSKTTSANYEFMYNTALYCFRYLMPYVNDLETVQAMLPYNLQ